MVRTRRESHHHDGITDPKDLQLPFATKSAQSGHRHRAERCPLLGVKRTSAAANPMSAFDPKRTSASLRRPSYASRLASTLRACLGIYSRRVFPALDFLPHARVPPRQHYWQVRAPSELDALREFLGIVQTAATPRNTRCCTIAGFSSAPSTRQRRGSLSKETRSRGPPFEP
jgi:hypothetical protein